MQKLSVKFKNEPRNTSLVPCSLSSRLNKVERLSVENKVRADNNIEENQRQHIGDHGLRVHGIVYVLNKRGYPLMPTSSFKARKLLKQGRAVVVKRFPFTIQLTYVTGESKQNVILGVDSGYENVGLSARTEKMELFSAEVKLRKNIKK